MDAEERREFVWKHRTCVFGFERRGGPPSMSVVYYVMDGDDILISTMADRAKARAVRRNPEVSLCVLTETWPFSYLLVYGKARIETEGTVDLMLRIGELMSGQPIP
jgi:PPOX class probable F420-dependent enzyme